MAFICMCVYVFVCICVCICMYVSVRQRVSNFNAHRKFLLSQARKFTHIVPVYPSVSWGSSPPSCNINRYILSSKYHTTGHVLLMDGFRVRLWLSTPSSMSLVQPSCGVLTFLYFSQPYQLVAALWKECECCLIRAWNYSLKFSWQSVW